MFSSFFENLLCGKILKGFLIFQALLVGFFLLATKTEVYASSTSTFNQTINPGTLAVDIVNASYVAVGSPTITMDPVTFSFSCQTATGVFGTATEQIYVTNPDAADGGWSVSLAASSTTDVWDSAGTDYDFNDPGTSGCVDDGATTDADDLGGELTVNASGGTLDVGGCASCVVTNITKGSSNAYEEGTTDSITILTGSSESDDIGDWTLENVSISQKIPAEQPVASDYNINMVLSITTL